MKRTSFIQRTFKNTTKGITNNIEINNTFDRNKIHFSTDINKNEHTLREQLGTSQDVMNLSLKIPLKDNKTINAILVAIDGLVNEEIIHNFVIKPLTDSLLDNNSIKNFTSIRSKLIVKDTEIEENFEKAINQVLKAKALLIVDGIPKGLLISVQGFETRSIGEPETEQKVRGAREGFSESININLSLIRRRIAHPSLRFEALDIGEFSQTTITIAYIKDIADPQLLKRVKKRLNQIKVDSINNSGEIEQLIEDHPYSIFPTVGNTELPDKMAALLMEGRVCILIDGDPVCLFAPFLFIEGTKHIEDYNSRPYYASFIRLIRFFSFILCITLPALYITAINFNKSLIPSDLILPLIMEKDSVPFPLALEIIMMLLMFELVREAGVRLPKQVGTAVSIIGPLILGEVAVTSSISSPSTLIIVSISYITSFVITSIADVSALLRIILFVAASLFGAYGFIVILLATITHMVSLTSLGVPYMAPLSPFYLQDWKDTLIRFPTRSLKYRPKSIPNLRPMKMSSIPEEDKS